METNQRERKGDAGESRGVGRAIRVLGSHLTLLVGGTAGTIAVLFHSWEIGALGATACGMLFAAERAGAWKKKRVLARGALESGETFADAQTSAAVDAIVGARTELERTLAETEASLIADLAPALAQIADLEARGAKLAKRSEEISRFLAKSDYGALRRECDTLKTRASQTRDPAARAHYAAAHAARADHLRTLDELVGTKERIGATLLSIAAALDALAPKIVRLRGLDGGASDLTRDVGRDLAAMTAELAAFEDVLVQVNEGSSQSSWTR